MTIIVSERPLSFYVHPLQALTQKTDLFRNYFCSLFSSPVVSSNGVFILFIVFGLYNKQYL